MGNCMGKTAIVPIILLALGLFGGCSLLPPGGQPRDNDLQRYALLEVYSPDGKLLQSIEDKGQIRKYIQYASWDITTESLEAMDELEETLAGHEPMCSIVSYKTPAARYTDGELERISEITLYHDTNIVREEIDPGVVKSGAVAKSALTSYYALSDEAMDFYLSLAEPSD